MRVVMFILSNYLSLSPYRLAIEFDSSRWALSGARIGSVLLLLSSPLFSPLELSSHTSLLRIYTAFHFSLNDEDVRDLGSF